MNPSSYYRYYFNQFNKVKTISDFLKFNAYFPIDGMQNAVHGDSFRNWVSGVYKDGILVYCNNHDTGIKWSPEGIEKQKRELREKIDALRAKL